MCGWFAIDNSGFANDRSIRVAPVQPDVAKFPHAAQLISVSRTATHKKTQESKTGTRYFVASLGPEEASPMDMGMKVRGYWGVESSHWQRDVLGKEDKCRLRNPNAACVLALLRTALLAVVRTAGHGRLKLAQEHFTNKPIPAINLVLNQRLA